MRAGQIQLGVGGWQGGRGGEGEPVEGRKPGSGGGYITSRPSPAPPSFTPYLGFHFLSVWVFGVGFFCLLSPISLSIVPHQHQMACEDQNKTS